MASCSERRIVALIAGGTIARGKAVKFGADGDHVVVGAANTDDCIGICQNDVVSGDRVEIALPGGGAHALAGESITKGKLLVSHTSGAMVQTNASADRVIAMALDDAASGDIFDVMVLAGVAVGADD